MNKNIKKDENKEEVEEELQEQDNEDSNKSKSHGEILTEQITEGCKIFDRSKKSILLSSFTAGLEIAFSFLLVCTVFSFFQEYYPPEVLFKLTAIVYPIGFILVVLGQSVLFTEQSSLLALPVLNNQRSVLSLFKIWGTVILGNLAGGTLMGLVLSWIGPKLGLYSTDTIAKIGEHFANYDFLTILVSAILAGWLMGLLSWLVTSARETVSEIIIIYLITAVMGITGLHHSIIGHIEIFAGMLVSSEISFVIYLKTILTALLGNAIGAIVFVALLKYRAFIFNIKVS